MDSWKNHVTELMCGENLSYLLENEEFLQPMEYKVLQNQEDGCLIKCMKLERNGKLQLFYLTKNYNTLDSTLAMSDANVVYGVIVNLLVSLISVKQIGFLSCGNLDLAPEHIYVDEKSNKVYLVYMPAYKQSEKHYSELEYQLRTEIVRVVSEKEEHRSYVLQMLVNKLADKKLTIEEIVCSEGISEKKNRVWLELLNSLEKMKFKVTKDEFVFGKENGKADCALQFNKAISRRHCKVCQNGNQNYISDLESKNGTYVNGVKLKPYEMQVLEDGDIIRMANSEFMVHIE